MFAAPDDRTDEHIRSIGRLAGSTFAEIVIREDNNPRGRKRGEVADMLGAAVTEGGLPAGKLSVVLDEVEAAHAAVQRAERNDLVVLMVDRPAVVWEALTSKGEDGRPRR